ncbi:MULTISPECIES: hypothetical protein [unclassified Marinimicrobium]|jgi:hypothetical protein|uniref:hypothetical protein n=1 Tax=unclassified Marinimicrobium TaxID=2632100 RepID=UPI000C3BC152|nr:MULTISPECIES: hypothetical protein [unclassified Marinimicrobium]MAN51029.1 hypothetical protein [Marinimicrobium sp.]|tara:strand:- start:962 stop:1903 length:942 start_codon:yes stop_codon:yes gene_type:complete
MRILIVLTWLLALPTGANEQRVTNGSGHYTYSSGAGQQQTRLKVYYHQPDSFAPSSPVLLVLPGAGRNAWDYRDAWKTASEKYGVLVISPHYAEERYPEFWNYNIAGMLTNVTINEARTGFASYEITQNPRRWLFKDFDGIFLDARKRFGIDADRYDMFGHSAGGQIIHRFALFGTSVHADRLIAANAGWYTLPDFDVKFPFGLKGSPLSEKTHRIAFSRNLVVFLGELDNADETRGHLARNDKLDVQGLHRFSRGQYFYRESKAIAEDIDADFTWQKIHVPGVGHDYRRMSEKAAQYLYTPKNQEHSRQEPQ